MSTAMCFSFIREQGNFPRGSLAYHWPEIGPDGFSSCKGAWEMKYVDFLVYIMWRKGFDEPKMYAMEAFKRLSACCLTFLYLILPSLSCNP